MTFTVCVSQVGRNHTALVGGKAATLGELSRLSGVTVPPGFCVTAPAFATVLASIPGADSAFDRLEALPADGSPS